MVDLEVQLAAPIAKELFKLIIDRHELREQAQTKKIINI